jgi:predicted HTH domain antitoxin
MNEFELKMMTASKLFEDGKSSSGQAAEIVGISKRSFVELIGKYRSPKRSSRTSFKKTCLLRNEKARH